MKKTKKILCFLLVFAMTFGCMSGIVSAAEMTWGEKPADGVTEDQPFAPGTGGSTNFRIPCMVTLDDGTIVTACDARWNHAGDGAGLDTIVSYSKDNGDTWNYTFANYLGDNGNTYNQYSTSFIDPAIATDGKTVYIIADLFPAGIALNTSKYGPVTGHTGYDANGNLALTDDKSADTNGDGVVDVDANQDGYMNSNDYVTKKDGAGNTVEISYDYSLVKKGNATEKDCYEVQKDGAAVEGYTIDAWFNIKSADGSVDTNLFCADSPYRPWPTDYLYLTKMTMSEDGEAIWSEPTLIDVKKPEEATVLICPGRATVVYPDANTKRIVFPVYEHTSGKERTSVIYSDDNGLTWERSGNMSGNNQSSEAGITEADGRLYVFTRKGKNYVSADYGVTWSEAEENEHSWCWDTQLSAITYSEKIDGKTAILLSVPGTYRRYNGKIFVALVDAETGALDWKYNYNVTDAGEQFNYSCLSELENGDIGLLWEWQGSAIRFDSYTLDEVLGFVKNIKMDPEEQFVDEYATDKAVEITQQPDTTVATVTSEYVVENSVTIVHNYEKATNSLASFSTQPGTYSVKDCEFTFTKNGNDWQIKNGSNYLDISTADNYLGSATNLTIEEIEGDIFRIKNPDNRYIIFYTENMTFDAWQTTNIPGVKNTVKFDLILLEKKETAAETDLVPGYEKATEVKDGGVYLIAYLWGTDTSTTDDDGVIVLYPANGQTTQTKLVGDTTSVAKNIVTITGVNPGTTTAVVGDITYNITIEDPTKRPDYAGRDIPVSVLSVQAGDQQSNDEAAGKVLDDEANTKWHTNWYGTSRENHHITFTLNDSYLVDGLRYQPRQDSSRNGNITEYEIQVSNDGVNFTKVAGGTWSEDASWKCAAFEAQDAKYIRLVAKNAFSDSQYVFASAATIRLTGEKSEVEPPVIENLLKAGSISASVETVTEGQPFAKGTAGSNIFRIPCLITLKDEEHKGTLVAAADARYTEYRDFGGIDTIASISKDGGETWNYSFPIYFPDSNASAGYGQATTAIDPAIVEGPDGTIYCFADMNPTGITTLDIYPGVGTGFVKINGVDRLALTGTYTKPSSNNAASYGNPENYEYYVGDFNEEGFAPVLNKADHTPTKWGVDEWYNIYTINAAGEYKATLAQTQVNSDTLIQQNAFYEGSVLHVYSTGYIWCVKSYDGGMSWEDPEILNPQIKREDGKETALLVSPGQGITTSKGDIVVGAYNTLNGEDASIFYSTDNGKTWKRSNDVNVGGKSSENEIIELPDGTLRMFYRSDTAKICYADITRQVGDNGEVTYVIGDGKQTGASSNSNCNVSAILLEDTTIDGKPVILASNPEAPVSWTRVNGKIFVFTLNEDNTMNHVYTYSVNEGEFAYSCMTELDNGNIGMLWEPGINQASAIRYDEFDIKEIIGLVKKIVLDPNEQYVEEKEADSAPAITQKPDEKIANVTSELEVSEAVIPLYDLGSVTESSLDSFNDEINTNINITDAEFTFNASGENWQIYNESTQKYLSNETSANTFFSSTAADMKVTASTEKEDMFTICRSTGSRYIIFHNPTMTFNSNGNWSANYGEGSYDLVLLEKQKEVSAEDTIPGYKRVDKITDGAKYLITHIWSDGSVIVLYPTNGTANQTKLVGEAQTVKTSVVTITAVAPGTTAAKVGEITYNITVEDPTKKPDYAGNDLSTEGMKLTAGTVENAHGLENLFDGNEASFYHSQWNGGLPTADDFWIIIEFPKETEISGLRYLPRQDLVNGRILAYEISYSLDGQAWSEPVSGEWADDASWKVARFDENVEAKYVKLFATDSKADSSGRHMTGAELRVLKAIEVPEEPEQKEEVCKVFPDVEHDQWYEDAVQFVYDNGIMSGSKGLFKPTANITRQQVVSTLYSMEGEPTITDYTAVSELKDLNAGEWYTNAVCWGYNTGVATGNSSTKMFGIGNDITRQQLAMMLMNYAEYKGYDIDTRGTYPSDLKGVDEVADYAAEAMQWAYGTGLLSGSKTTVNGVTVYNLKPTGYASRAQMASILMNFCERNGL